MLFFMITGDTAPSHAVRQLHIDENLFARIGADDRDAFEELYTISERTVYAYVLSLLKNPDDTLDIVQETFLKIRAAAHLYIPMGKPLAWMFTIARNLSMNHLRSRNRHTDGGMDSLENSLDFAYITDETDRLILESALAILGEEERQILLLHAVSGLKHREIAESISAPLSTVLSRYNRALKKLKKHLVEQGVSR